MFATKVRVYAKLNLSLNITGKEKGYHAVDSVVASVNIWDTICVKPRRDKLVNVYMHGKGSENIPPERNNAVKAGERFAEVFGTNGADVEIYKDIPIGAGLGGSSADAAGVLLAMSKAYKVGTDASLRAIADSLGSDTGYMLRGGYSRLTGRGEQISEIKGDTRLWFLMLLPKSGVSTGACYAQYDLERRQEQCNNAALCAAIEAGDVQGVAKHISNSLLNAAGKLNSEVVQAVEAARGLSPMAVGMTGSGSGVFALFENEAMCSWAKSRYKGKIPTRVVHTVQRKQKKGWMRNPFVLSEQERAMAENEETGAENGREEP